jgi:hypothetical protein
MPLPPIQGSEFTTISIGTAIVSKGTISVAMMMERTIDLPRNCRKAKEKDSHEDRVEDEKPDRRALKGAEIVIKRHIADWQEGVERGRVPQQLRVRLERAYHHEDDREDEDQRHEDKQQVFQARLEVLVRRGNGSHVQRSLVT